MHQQQLKGHVRILAKGHHLGPFFLEKKKTQVNIDVVGV
jgi:hypothetical protein